MKHRKCCFILACSTTLLTSFTSALSAQTTISGLIHLWSGEGDANDLVGSANGTLGATTAFAPGLYGQAFSFDGQQSSIINPLPVNLNPSALPQMTMGMFVNLRSVPNNRGWVIGHDNGGFDRSLILADDRYGFGVAGGTGGPPHLSTLIKLKDNLNTWRCVAVSYDRDAQTATFYADGMTQTVGANPRSGRSHATLGGLAVFADHTVDGLVDEVFMFNRALTTTEIDQVCEDLLDDDGDGVRNHEDHCPETQADEVVDEAGCSMTQLCPCNDPWRNHGQYVSCVAHAAEDFSDGGLITEAEKDAIVSEAGQSDCGKKDK